MGKQVNLYAKNADLWSAARARALADGISLSQLVEEAVAARLAAPVAVSLEDRVAALERKLGIE